MPLLLLLLITSALAGRGVFYLEAPPTATRPESVEVVREATARGWSARVVRRYRHGIGWEFVARVEGFDEEARAAEAARALGDATGGDVTVYVAEGGSARVVDAGEPSAAREEAARTAPSGERGALTVAQWVEHAGRAHGGVGGGLAAIDAAERVVFRFRRRVPDGPVVEHTWVRRGGDRYVQVDVIEGEGVSSRAWILGDAAWLAVAGEAPRTQDVTRAREALERFSPHQTVGLPLRIGAAAASRSDLERLHRVGPVVVDGAPCEQLRYDGTRGEGSMALAIDARSYHVRQVQTGGDADPLVRSFRDYRDLGSDLVVPFDVRARRGDRLIDEVEVLDLDLAPRILEEWFVVPTAGAPD